MNDTRLHLLDYLTNALRRVKQRNNKICGSEEA